MQFLLIYREAIKYLMNSDDQSDSVIPNYISGLRYIIGKSHNQPSNVFTTFFEAKKSTNSVAVFEGDYGGQIYAVIKVSEIHCSEKTLYSLLFELDELGWHDPEGVGLYFEDLNNRKSISGGMGGGVATDTIWVHPKIKELSPNIEENIRKKIT